jgi:hypothetical protein
MNLDGSVATADLGAGLDEHVADALVTPFPIVKGLVGREGPVKRPGAEEHQLVDHFLPCTTDPPLRDGVAVRGRGRAVDEFDPGLGEDRLEGYGELRVTIGDQEPLPTKDPIDQQTPRAS